MSSIVTDDTAQGELDDRRVPDLSAHPTQPKPQGRGIGFVATVAIARPVPDVFDYVVDFTRAPTWNYWVRSVHKTTSGPIRVGTVFHQVRRDDQQDYRVTVYGPPHRVTVATLDGSWPAFTRAIHLQPTARGTHLTDRWQLDTGHPALVQALAAGRVRAAVTANLTRLAELLETGRTVLPDGRAVGRDRGGARQARG